MYLFFWERSASRIYDTSRRLVLTHTYFQQECLNRKFSSRNAAPSAAPSPSLLPNLLPGSPLMLHLLALLSSSTPSTRRMLSSPRLKGKRLGRYLLFLSIETFSAGCYPRPRAGARPKPRWTDHWTPHYIGPGGGAGLGLVSRGLFNKAAGTGGFALSCFVGRTAGNGAC